MAAFANVAGTDIFSTWRTRFNQTLQRLNAFAINESSLYANTLTANSSFTSKGLATMQGRATVGTNLTVSGNTSLGGLATITTANAVFSGSTTNPLVRITQTGAGNALLVEDSANPDSTPFVVDSSGRVIVGTTSSIAGAGGTPGLIQVIGTSAPTISVQNWTASLNDPARLGFDRSGSSTIGTRGIVSDGADIGRIRFAADDGVAFIEAANILAEVDGTPGTNDMPGRLVFSTTADGASTPTERMRIDNAGSVGIGTSSTTGNNLRLGKALTNSATAKGVRVDGVIQSDVTTTATYFDAVLSTAASSFTLPTLYGFFAQQSTFGAGSVVTNQYGFAASSNMTGATNNYGFYSNIASGTGRWNFYASGTANNYFAGAVSINRSLSITQNLTVSGNTTVGGVKANNSLGTSGYVLKTNGTTTFWGAVAAGASAGIFYENDQTVTSNYTITTNKNAISQGPLTINNGVTVTVPNNSVWTVFVTA